MPLHSVPPPPPSSPEPLRPRGPARALTGAPSDYVVICISTYVRDLAKLDAMVAELKRRGVTKANRSALIRVALDQLDLDKVPRGL
jgi:hypothetical protein